MADEKQLPAYPPNVTVENEEFWKAAADGRFLLKRCDADGCGTVIWYPRSLCPECGSFDTSWFEASGKGTIYTYTIVHKGQGPWAEHVPYVTAYVELEEGPRVMTNIVGVDPADVAVGMAVEVVFQDAGDGAAIYRFRPAIP
ncbi:MAG TPA: Zn-ribbon domain-containing OB-fold protein [Acidimicrobiales bacterium]|jgi:uncharacterized protein|nr:Zn-ribbon domain-containing OB-fold protein [Acidimicrobiales bacterium]